jgi:SAM-dependent MidA family methyltransferase
VTTGNSALLEIIRAEIQNRGPVSFAWFMQQALYHPEHGYYSSGRCAIGRGGDYFTNVSVGPLFGQLLAAQFAEIWERLDQIDNFVIVEQGAHHGDFARDVLESASKRSPNFFAALRYRIIEPFAVLQDRQLQTLQLFCDKVEWRDSIEPFVGVHFSNELLDAMPVRLIGHGGEKFVDLDGDKLVFVERPARDDIAFNQAALDWIENVAANLRRGYIIAVDYGHPRDEFRPSVQVRAQHRHLDSPFEQIGHADITAHVEWTSIVERAEACGLDVTGFTDQHHFITGILSELLRDEFSNEADVKTKRALQTLLHPEMLGRSFQVLALQKGASAADAAVNSTDPHFAAALAGFKFAREPQRLLLSKGLADCSRVRTAHGSGNQT